MAARFTTLIEHPMTAGFHIISSSARLRLILLLFPLVVLACWIGTVADARSKSAEHQEATEKGFPVEEECPPVNREQRHARVPAPFRAETSCAPSDSGNPVELSVLADPAELNEYLTKTFQKAGRLDAALIEELTDLAVSQNGNPAIQDYGLQFLGAAVGELGTNHESSVRSAVSVLRDGATLPDSTWAGTSLLALRKASTVRPDLVPAEEVCRISESIADDPSYSDASRTTALLVMEREHHPRSREVAQAILREPGAGAILRQTAKAVAERLSGR